MKQKTIVAITAAWILSLVGAAAWAQSTAPTIREGQNIGDVITGDRIGFQRVAGVPNAQGKIVGRLMVKIGPTWFEAQAPITLMQSK